MQWRPLGEKEKKMKPKPFNSSEEAYHFARLLHERGYAPTVQILNGKFRVQSGAPQNVWQEVTKKFEWQRSLRKVANGQKPEAKQEKLI